MKKLAIALAAPALALAATQASALDTAVYSQNFGTNHSTTLVPVGAGLVTNLLTLPTFGSVITTESIVAPVGQQIVLDSIHLTLNAALSTTGTLQNTSNLNERGTLDILLTNPWQVSITNSPTGGANVNNVYSFQASGSILSTQTPGYPAFTLTPGQTWIVPQQNSDKGPLGVNLTSLGITGGDWFNSGTFTASFGIGAVTSLAAEADGGTGSYAVTFATGTWGQAQIQYDYRFRDIPAPAPLALIALGLAGLGASRRRAKTIAK